MSRVYLDHNATTPLSAEAREAMISAMDAVGNPSSVHTEGRKAKAIVERARSQVAGLVGCAPQEVVFTSGATEAAAIAASFADHVFPSPVEHDCVYAQGKHGGGAGKSTRWDKCFSVDQYGRVGLGAPEESDSEDGPSQRLFCLQAANSETGICQPAPDVAARSVLCDVVQAVGRMCEDWTARADFLLLSAHKMGGPKGIGALIVANRSSQMIESHTPIRGGGQELGRRSGTENVIGIAGFGAAAEVARRNLANGRWAEVEKLRNILENTLEGFSKETIFVGKGVPRLPNTSCILTPGWKGETQVMQMDLAGFAISAGSACSSGKVKESRVLKAMGFSDQDAASSIRVSIGLETTEDEVLRFAESWGRACKKHKARVA